MIGARHLALGMAVAFGPVAGFAQSNAPSDVAPVPLSPLIAGLPNAPLPARPAAPPPSGSVAPPPRGSAQSTSQALPAPDLPAASMVAPPGFDHPGIGRPMPGDAPAGQPPPGNDQPDGDNAPAQVKPVWDRRGVAVLDVLDKEDGAVHRIQIPTGTAVTEGKLSLAVAACVVRPADMTADAAMFVTVTTVAPPVGHAAASSTPGPIFRGWLIRSEPGATVVGDAAVTFRLIGCDGG